MMRSIVHRLAAALAVLPALLYGGGAPFATATAQAATREAHIALLLPLAAPSFSRHADAVRRGFAAASAAATGAPPIRIYAVNEDTLNVLAVYEEAVESGAQLIVGPLTRNGVAALAASNLVTVPTLALNTLDTGSPQPARLYLFGIGAEQEARQVARLAFDDGRRKAYIVGDDTPVSRRMRQAFLETFARLGGVTAAQTTVDAAGVARLREAAEGGVDNMVFLAVDFTRARVLRPYLGTALAIYATSQVNAGGDAAAARALDLVRFVDMPWLLQPDHPAVMIYPRAQFDGNADFDRLYALGIDAFRLGLELLRGNRDPVLDGVTGQIRVTRDQQFVRELTAARFSDGKIMLVGKPR